jgi:hypothetical protein
VIYTPQFAGDEDVIEAGAVGGCTVIPEVFKEYSTHKDSLWHYWAKARAFRYIRRQIRKAGNRELYHEWGDDERLEEGAIPVVETTRPRNLPDEILVGKEKAAAFYPSNFFRMVEAVRLDKKGLTHPVTGMRLIMTPEDRENMQIDWQGKMAEAIQLSANSSTNLMEFSGKVIAHTYKHLISNDLDPYIARALLLTGVNPKYHLFERGEVERVRRLWKIIINELDGLNPTFIRQDLNDLWRKVTDQYNDEAFAKGIDRYIQFEPI